MGLEMVQPDSNKQEIGIIALGNLLHSQYNSININDLRQFLPPNVEMITADTTGNAILGFLKNKQRLIIIDNTRAHQLTSGEILYWSQTLGAELQEIITLGPEEEFETLIHVVERQLQEWGAAVNH